MNHESKAARVHELAKESGAQDILSDKLNTIRKRVRFLESVLSKLTPDTVDHYLIKEEIDSELSNYKSTKHQLYVGMNVFNTNPQEFNIPLIKEVPITELYVFEQPRETSNRLKALCPFHKERTPSFIVFKDDNQYHCFGCGAHGDNIAFVMETQNLGFVDACRLINKYT